MWDKDYYTIPDVAKLLGMSETMVVKRKNDGLLPAPVDGPPLMSGKRVYWEKHVIDPIARLHKKVIKNNFYK